MKKVLPILMLLALFGLSKGIAQTFYVNTSFPTSTIPTGWTSTTSTTGGQWDFGSGYTNSYLNLASLGTYAVINDATCACVENAAHLTTPTNFNMTAATTVFMTFTYYYAEYHTNSPGNVEIFYLQYTTNGGSSWSLLDSVPASYDHNTGAPLVGTFIADISAQVATHNNVGFRWVYSDQGTAVVGAAITNVQVWAPLAHDAAITSVAPVANTSASYGITWTQVSISGTIFNAGSSPITSALIYWSYGPNNNYAYNYTGNIPPLGSANFTHTIPYTIMSGPTQLKVYPVLNGDWNHANDTMTTTITGASFMPFHKVTVEEETGTWCGWCVRGMIFLDSMKNTPAYAPNCELIAVHDGDVMTVATYDAGATTLPGFSGFPSIEVDRKVIDDPSNIFAEYAAHINDFGIADISIANNFNSSTRNLTVTAKAHFAVPVSPASGTYRLALVVTEDNVHDTSAAYEQTDYYYGQANSGNYALPTVDGYDFHTIASTYNNSLSHWDVNANLMYYPDVARTILSTYTGSSGSLPATIAAGATETYLFSTYNVPAAYNTANMKVIVLLINTTTGQIMNANDLALLSTGVTEINPILNSVNIYPNPFSTQTNININLAKASDVTVSITNLLGQVVDSFNSGTLSEGNHNIVFNSKDLSNGMYFVTLKTGANTFTQKISIQK